MEIEKEGFKAEPDGPLVIVTSTRKDNFVKAHLVRVLLESIAGWEDLQRIVVKPLAALVQGEVEKAKSLLAGVETIPWPSRFAENENQAEEQEKREQV